MNNTTKELLEKHFDTAFAAPDGIKKLRELILTLAMQGKLVPQDPQDQPASELLKEIEAEKKRLVKEGKIKAGSREDAKSAKEIKPGNVPYELPDGWEWVRLGMVLPDYQNGISKRDSKNGTERIVIRLADIKYGEISLADPRSIRLTDEELRKYELTTNDILITRVNGSTDLIGNFALIKKSNGLTYCDHFIRLRVPQNLIASIYLCKLASSSLLRKQIVDKFVTTAGQKTVNQGHISSLILPLPPIAEQRRIVAKIEQLMARCDELEKLRAEREQKRLIVHTAALSRLLEPSFPRRLESSDSKLEKTGSPTETFGDDERYSIPSDAWQFISKHFGELYSVKENVAELRKAILQLAVMGKLVPQDPNDQPASELLKDIEAGKKRLVKEGKIKAPKPLQQIKTEEVPYLLPEGWEWIRFFTANTVKSELVSARDYPLEKQIAPDSIEKGSGRLLFHRTVEEFGAIGPNNKFYEGQILYSKIRPSLNKAVIAPYSGLCSADMYPIKTHVNADFMLKVILSETFLEQVRQAENRVKMPKLNLESLGQFQIPLPPLAEQHRIVAKIDQLMVLCDELDKQIDASTQKQTTLLNAVMAQV